MLKSTYKPAVAPSPLPAGWTEHKAPTGHLYYYNATTQQSTYTRPSTDSPYPNQLSYTETPYDQLPFQPKIQQHGTQYPPSAGQHQPVEPSDQSAIGSSAGRNAQQRPQPKDRPKSKHAIPGCEPWILVNTKLRRRFVYNPDSNESFWKFPPDVLKAVVEFDRLEREKKAQGEAGSIAGDSVQEPSRNAGQQGNSIPGPFPSSGQDTQDNPADESDEYEEVEVTDDEEIDDRVLKRQKTGDEGEEQPVEFNEDDIAYQLAAMGQDYGLDPGEYGDPDDQDLEEGAEGLPLSEEDASALFKDMLDDYHINPYNTWEKLIDDGHVVEDDRYTVLPNTRTRKEVWGEWSRDRIQRLKEQREKEEKKDPRIPYFIFLEAKATPKLYWPEFRRKYMKEPEMRNNKLSDKEREKWYRDYINRLKLPESTLKSDLVSMLKSMPLHALNRSTSMAGLPPIMLTDMRFISVRSSIRNPLIETHISTLPEAPEGTDMNAEDQEAMVKQKQERERREALAERQMQVQREKKKAREALEHSKGMMREGEQEIQRAMKVGKGGLLAYLEKDEQPPLPPEEESQ
ncbi:MAG: hypothetical protein Q9219_000958 [cf. Caloplaca sp. 3 TL-2023]